jgi:hypothetical protein
VGPKELIQAQAEAITAVSDQCPQNAPALGRNYGEINVPTVIRKGTGKMNVSNGPGIPRRLPRPEAEAKLLRESISLFAGRLVSMRKTLSDWQA